MKTIVIDKTIKNIKKNNLQGFRRNTYIKNIKKNTLQGFGENAYSKNSKYKFFYFFLVFPTYKTG